MVEAVVHVALETLRNLLLEETKFLSDSMSSQVKGLEKQLKEIQYLLQDAGRGRQESKSIGNWTAEIRDLAYRAQDIIQTYAVQVSSRRAAGSLIRKLLQRFFNCVLNNNGFSLCQIGLEISDIKSEIARVYKSMQECGAIRSIIQGANCLAAAADDENQRWKRRTHSFDMDDCFVGMEDDLKRLISLVGDDKQDRVITVWGMGGIGKTTIARKVYNHVEIKNSFQSFAWVCITQQCRIRFVLEDVLKQLIPHKKEDIMYFSDAELVEHLCLVQKDKRCFVVLDDIWKSQDWDCLKDAFLAAKLRSKILVTTRKQNVVDVGFCFKLGLLNIVDGWELLKKIAFSGDYVPGFGLEDKLVEEVGKKMVQKCGYLPLVISLLGGVLREKKRLEEWELVNNNMDAYLYSAGSIENNKIHEIVLDLSYDDLPCYLKECFLYMGQFQEGQYIYADNLYMLWIAEGLISLESNQLGSDKVTLMDVAEVYLSELVSRCIVQVVVVEGAANNLSTKKYISCHLHDVVRELCLSKGKKEDFRLKVVDCRGGKLEVVDPSLLGTIKIRYLTIHFRGEVEPEQVEFTTSTQEDTTQYVRSLKFLNHFNQRKIEIPHNVVNFRKFKLVRVLVFEGCSFERRKLPKEIGYLIHLRYLRLRRCELDKLPSSISNLIYLNTLDLFHSWDVRVPNVLKKMLRLKHLFLPDYKKDINVRRYGLGLEGLNELETLIGFNSLVHDLKFLSTMKNLQHFQATVHDSQTLSAIIYEINTNRNRNNLRESTLVIKNGCELPSSILEKLLICPNLHSLWIDVHIGKLPQQCGIGGQLIFPTLILLTLRKCEIGDDPMELLERLPCLESLCLWPTSYVGKKMTCRATGFRQLKALQLWGLPNLMEWRVEDGAMPNLSELEITDCPKLETIPDGLRSITTLEEVEISEIPGQGKRVSARRRGFQQCLPCTFRHHLSND